MFDIESIQSLYNGNAVKHREHFILRIKERSIRRKEISHAILTGKIIEQYPDDEPLPSILILGYTKDNKPLHVAVSIDDDIIWLVTAYYPALDIWETDYKTKKVI
ncbi:MAG: DUF4258 domain-containing protein [Defluviitaleaceae bacterium]|nr:DUF4258 domain-containing protein [Defluviitaleaceae bacterium]